MDNHLNETIIEKVVIKKAAIYKAIAMLPPPPFEDKFAKETICQQNENTPKQNSEKCLNEIEPNNEKKVNDTMNETKTVNELENWRTITDPKLRRKMWEKTYRKTNRNKKKLYKKNWYQVNKERERVKQNTYYKIRYENNIQFRLTQSLRARLRNALKNNHKRGSAVRDLGCTVDEFKVYLESKFLPGMSWDNYGYHGWHIDHIKPLSLYDLTDRNQLLEACHYTNLQPLWASDNLSKKDCLNWEKKETVL
jgi:hypothetical protein